MRLPVLIGLLLVVVAMLIYFISSNNSIPPAQKVLNQALKAHGSAQLDNSLLEFDFRDRHYRASRKGGQFTYERIFRDTLEQEVHDTYSNDGFARKINGELAEITEERAFAYTNSINSVIYFALLPYFLNDPATQKSYAGEETIKGEAYHKIKVTFQQEGGGKDFEDEFMYWFHQEKNTMDYLAYNYLTDGGGARFRVAYNVRTIDGIRFADFINLKPKEKTNRAIETFGQLYEQGELIELSKIESEDIKMKIGGL